MQSVVFIMNYISRIKIIHNGLQIDLLENRTLLLISYMIMITLKMLWTIELFYHEKPFKF